MVVGRLPDGGFRGQSESPTKSVSYLAGNEYGAGRVTDYVVRHRTHHGADEASPAARAGDDESGTLISGVLADALSGEPGQHLRRNFRTTEASGGLGQNDLTCGDRVAPFLVELLHRHHRPCEAGASDHRRVRFRNRHHQDDVRGGFTKRREATPDGIHRQLRPICAAHHLISHI